MPSAGAEEIVSFGFEKDRIGGDYGISTTHVSDIRRRKARVAA